MTSTGAPAPRTIWVRLGVDPLAVPLSRVLAPRACVTPNRVTWVALGCALASAAAFLLGLPRWGGALFLARFFCDCVDGMVARRQGSSSARGAALDLAVDVVGVHLVAASLCWWLVDSGRLAPGGALGLLGVLGVYNWSLDRRKLLAGRLGAGDGGSDHTWHSDLPVLRIWLDWCRRLNMQAFPWVLEVEIGVLGLGPLLAPTQALPALVWAGVAAYLLATAVNLRRIARLALALDRSGPHPQEES